MKVKKKILSTKICVTIICGSLLLALYVMIFSFSAQNGEQSGSLSARV